jgi:hypothetical protein
MKPPTSVETVGLGQSGGHGVYARISEINAGTAAIEVSPRRVVWLLSDGTPHRIFQAADGVLHLAFNLVGVAFSLQFGVPNSFANCLFHVSFNLLC